MVIVHNPVLRGFHPDPSILRVGADYFLATSTFEYHPGVRIHHSTDLARWDVLTHALTEDHDLRGVPDSGGVWAPSLSFADGRFWLAYSIVRTMDGDDKDIANYLITADDIRGPWSRPVFLGSRGFDFSFFHDDDGTHWIVGVQWDHRPGHPAFGGLVLEQYLPEHERTSGQATVLYREEGLIEGPNLYHINGWYYLLIACGGTGWNHGITLARSRSLTGPYERDPAEAILTSRDAPGLPLQKAGHGELVQTPRGEWVLAHLAARPALHFGERYCTLGRETCLQRVEFTTDGWLRLAQGGHHAAVDVEFDVDDDRVIRPPAEQSWREDFDGPGLDARRWATLRAPLDAATADLSSRPGWLRLRGGSSTASVFDQAMILTRVQEHSTSFEVVMDAEPRTSREAAGLIAWYDRDGWIWLQLTWEAGVGRHVRVVRRDAGVTVRSEPLLVPEGALRLRATTAGASLTFAIAPEGGGEWITVPGEYPAWTLSDDHGARLRFTGMFVGVRAEDLDGRGWMADFDDVRVAFREVGD